MLGAFGRHLALLGAVALAWQVLSWLAADPVLPGPVAAVADMFDSLRKERFRSSVVTSLGSVVWASFIAIGAGVTAGLLLGMAGRRLRPVGRLLYAVNSLPKVLFYPVVLVAMGLNQSAQIAFGALSGFFIVVLVSMEAVHTVDARMLKLARAYRMGPWQTVRFVMAPGLFPHLFVAVRMGFSTAFLAVVVAEMFASSAGIGNEVIRQVLTGAVDAILGTVLFIVVIAGIPAVGLYLLERTVKRRFGVA